jgi:hypothetical protein
MKSLYAVVAFSFAAALATSGCGGIAEPSKNQVDTYSDILPVGGSVAPYQVNVSKSGELFVRVTAISPNPASLLGTLLGQMTAGGCVPITQNNFTGLNRDTLNYPVTKGGYCVVVYDNGSLTASQSFTIEISHP